MYHPQVVRHDVFIASLVRLRLWSEVGWYPTYAEFGFTWIGSLVTEIQDSHG